MTARGVTRPRRRTALLVALAAIVWVLEACGVSLSDDVACAQEVAPRLGLRVLLVGEREETITYRAWKALLEWEGVPHDTLVGGGSPLTAEALRDDAGHHAYQAVVLAGDRLGEAPLSVDERAVLDGYADASGARIVHAFGAVPEAVVGAPEGISDVRLDVTAEGRPWFPEIIGPVDVEGGFGVLPGPTPGAVALVTGPGGAPVVSERRVSAHDELHVTLALPATEPAFGFLSHGLLGWATRGVHLGLRHHFFAVHIDDVLLPNFRWDMEANETAFGGGDVIRMTPEDVGRAAAWSERQDFRLDLAFNGGGSNVDGVHSFGVCNALRDHVDDFGWLNHTFEHRDFDDLSAGEMTTQIARNIEWAEANGFPIDERELATGEHSGLGNPAIVPALEATDIAYIASDASREPAPERLGVAWKVPRLPANIYYDTGTFEETLDQYDHTYRESCEGEFCLEARPTWEEYLGLESASILKFVNGNDPRTFYLHQSNLAEEGTLYPVVDAVLERFRSVSSQPVLQPTLTESGEAQLERLAWQTALAEGAVTAHLEAGSVVVRSERDLRVPVTGAGDERYGAERSGWVPIGAGDELRIPVAVDAG